MLQSNEQIIGKVIKQARLNLKMSQLELSTKVGHESSAYIALLEQAKRKVNLQDFIKICRVLKLRVVIEDVVRIDQASLSFESLCNIK